MYNFFFYLHVFGYYFIIQTNTKNDFRIFGKRLFRLCRSMSGVTFSTEINTIIRGWVYAKWSTFLFYQPANISSRDLIPAIITIFPMMARHLVTLGMFFISVRSWYGSNKYSLKWQSKFFFFNLTKKYRLPKHSQMHHLPFILIINKICFCNL